MQLNKTFERLKKMISKGMYDHDTLLLDIKDFLEMGTITNESYEMLLEMMNVSPATCLTMERMGDFETYTNTGDTTYLLLKKQIMKQVYSEEVIKQMITDFRITSTISRVQFMELKDLIQSLYNPQPDYELEIDGGDSI